MLLVKFEGRVYDVSVFKPRHPGGAYIFDAVQDTDITPLVHSYHGDVGMVRAALATHAREVSPSLERPIPDSNYDYGLYEQLKAEVYARLPALRRNRRWSARTWWRSAFLAAIYAGIVLAYLVQPTWWIAVAFAVMGVGFAGLVQHEALHHAVSRRPWVNYAARFFLYPFVAPSTFERSHVVLHHPHPNTDLDRDYSDLPLMGVARLGARWPHRPWYRGQLYYLLFLLNSTIVVFKGPLASLACLFGRFDGVRHRLARLDAGLHLVVFYMFFIHPVVANWGSPLPWLPPLVLALVYGNIFAIISQVNHINEANTREPMDAASARDFCRRQVETATNYGTNPWTAFICSGLDHQVEHHLFPGVSTEHYPAIAPIVREFCARHGIRYHRKENFLAAFLDWAGHIRQCGLADGN